MIKINWTFNQLRSHEYYFSRHIFIEIEAFDVINIDVSHHGCDARQLFEEVWLITCLDDELMLVLNVGFLNLLRATDTLIKGLAKHAVHREGRQITSDLLRDDT